MRRVLLAAALAAVVASGCDNFGGYFVVHAVNTAPGERILVVEGAGFNQTGAAFKIRVPSDGAPYASRVRLFSDGGHVRVYDASCGLLAEFDVATSGTYLLTTSGSSAPALTTIDPSADATLLGDAQTSCY